jgi:hypothetical protein
MVFGVPRLPMEKGDLEKIQATLLRGFWAIELMALKRSK